MSWFAGAGAAHLSAHVLTCGHMAAQPSIMWTCDNIWLRFLCRMHSLPWIRRWDSPPSLRSEGPTRARVPSSARHGCVQQTQGRSMDDHGINGVPRFFGMIPTLSPLMTLDLDGSVQNVRSLLSGHLGKILEIHHLPRSDVVRASEGRPVRRVGELRRCGQVCSTLQQIECDTTAVTHALTWEAGQQALQRCLWSLSPDSPPARGPGRHRTFKTGQWTATQGQSYGCAPQGAVIAQSVSPHGGHGGHPAPERVS